MDIHVALVARGWRLLYLDGSTPTGRRATLVDSFQNGEADAFLISLKAGGTGLNLTAAVLEPGSGGGGGGDEPRHPVKSFAIAPRTL